MLKVHYKRFCLTLLVIVFLAILLATKFYGLDKNLVIEFNRHRSGRLDVLFLYLTYSARIVTYVVAGICLLLYFIKSKLLEKVVLFAVPLAIILSALLATLIKYGIQRIRPFHLYPAIQHLGPATSWSCPSGHTCDAFVLAGIISLFFPKKNLTVVLYGWALMVGVSRVYLGVHYPSDVLFGICTGSSMALLARYICLNRNLLITSNTNI